MCYEKFINQDSGSLTGLEERVSSLEDTIDRLCEAVERIDLLFDAVTDLKKSVDSLREKMCDLNKSLKDSRNELSMATESKPISRITESDITLFSEMHKDELEIVGIPFKEGEDVLFIVLNCAREVDVNLQKSDLKNVYRGRKRGDNDGIIHVCFRNTKKCNEFISKCKAKRINTQILGFDEQCRPVFVNKPLSSFSKQLLYKSKQFKNEFKWKYLWARNGRIYLKKSEFDKPIHVTSEQDLLALQV